MMVAINIRYKEDKLRLRKFAKNFRIEDDDAVNNMKIKSSRRSKTDMEENVVFANSYLKLK